MVSEKISIIVTTYNRAPKIATCLESIYNQSNQLFELIIVDDGSTDGTKDLLRAYAQKENTHVFFLDKNYGASYARNYGIGKSNGTLVMVWDSDDVLYPNAFETIYNCFLKNPTCATVSAPTIEVCNDKKIYQPSLQSGFLTPEQIACKFFGNNEKIRVSRRECFTSVQYRSRNIDFMVNVELAVQGPWYHIHEYLGTVYIASDGVSLTKKRKQKNKLLSIERAHYLDAFLTTYGYLYKDCMQRYADNAYGAALGFLLEGDTTKARVYISHMMRGSVIHKLKSLFLYSISLSRYSMRVLQSLYL